MKIRSASQTGRVFTTVLACALATAAIPAWAAGKAAVPAPSRFMADPVLTPTDDAYSLAAGDTLTVLAPGIVANDINYDIATVPPVVSLVSAPQHGSLALTAGGAFQYTPAKGFSGQDTFRYGISEGEVYGEANVTLFVIAPMELALSAAAAAPTASVGSPVTFTFSVHNQGLVDADDVWLQIGTSYPAGSQTPDGGTSAFGEDAPSAGTPNGNGSGSGTTPEFSGAPCTGGAAGSWTCRLGRVASGATSEVSVTLIAQSAGTLRATGNVSAGPADGGTVGSTASAETLVGRVTTTARLTGRAPWTGGREGTEVSTWLTLNNDSPLGLTYAVNATDPTASDDLTPGWFSVSPASGSVDAFSTQQLPARMSTAGLTPGLKRGVLHFTHDSPFAVEDVPVSFTVAFHDVDARRSDDRFIHALAGADVTSGCRAGNFCPDQTLSRAGASVWLLLAREGSGYQVAAAEGLFQDVSLDRAEAPYVEELARRGVAGGCDADLFCPDAPLARADAAVIVIRMLQGVRYTPQPVTGRPMFRDLRDDARAAWVEDAVRRGIFSACAAGPHTFCPNDGITRGDAAVSLVKAFNLPLE